MALLSSSGNDKMESEKQMAKETVKQAKRRESEPAGTGGDIAVLAAIASVGFSWYQYHVRGDKEYGLFTGLWAPTILAFASYLKQKSMEERMENSLLSGAAMRGVKSLLK